MLAETQCASGHSLHSIFVTNAGLENAPLLHASTIMHKQTSCFAVGVVVIASCVNSTVRQSLPALVPNKQSASQNRLTFGLYRTWNCQVWITRQLYVHNFVMTQFCSFSQWCASDDQFPKLHCSAKLGVPQLHSSAELGKLSGSVCT